MFKSKLHKNLYSGASEETSKHSARAFFDVELPFTPFVGLTIFFGQGAYGRVEQVNWDVNKDTFIVFCGNDFMATGHPEHDLHDFEDWIAMQADCGWQVTKVMARLREGANEH